jgi:TolA-binding protein
MTRRYPLRRLAAAAAAALCLPAGALEGPERLQFADGLYSRGMFDLAIKEYRAFLDSHPRGEGSDTACYRMAESYLSLTNAAAAEPLFRRVFSDFPRSPFRFKAWFRSADAGRTETACAYLDAMLAATPPADLAAAGLYRLGGLRAHLGQRVLAAQAYGRIRADFSSSPFYAHALLALAGMAGRSATEIEEAASMLRSAATQATSSRLSAEAWYQLGELEFRRDAWEAAARAYAQVAVVAADDVRVAETRIQRAWCLYNQGRYAETLQAFDADAAAPGAARTSEWLYLKANALRQLRRYDEAVDAYARFLARHRDDALAPAAAYERTLSLHRAGRHREAIEAAEALKPKPELKADVAWILAESHAAIKAPEKAIPHYRALVDQFAGSPLRPHAMYRLAHLLQSRAQYAEAAEQYAALVQAYPAADTVPQALFASALCHLKLGKHGEAVRDWSALLKRFPDHALAEESLYQKALGLVHLKQDDSAAAALAELLNRFPKSRYAPEARYWSGMLHDAAGRADEAAAEYRAALAGGLAGELGFKTQFRLAVTLQKLEKPAESAALLDALVAGGKTADCPPELIEWLALHHLDRSEHKAAAAAAQAGLATAEGAKRPMLWLALARARRGLQEYAAADEAYGKAMAGEGRPAIEAALETGEMSLDARALRQAATAFDKAAAMAADDRYLPLRAAAYAGKAKALRADGRNEEAAKLFMSVAILFDDGSLVPACLLEAERAFRLAGRKDDAAKAADELRRRYPNSTWVRQLGEGESGKPGTPR